MRSGLVQSALSYIERHNPAAMFSDHSRIKGCFNFLQYPEIHPFIHPHSQANQALRLRLAHFTTKICGASYSWKKRGDVELRSAMLVMQRQRLCSRKRAHCFCGVLEYCHSLLDVSLFIPSEASESMASTMTRTKAVGLALESCSSIPLGPKNTDITEKLKAKQPGSRTLVPAAENVSFGCR